MRSPWRRMNRRRSRGVKMELVTPMMEMILITPTLMVEMTVMEMMVIMEMMMVMEMMVETEEMVEVTMRMTTMQHYLLRGGQWRSTMIYMVMPTTIQSFSPLYAATNQVHHVVLDGALDPP